MKEGIPSEDISFMKTNTSPEDSIAISIAPHTCRADRATRSAYPGDISFHQIKHKKNKNERESEDGRGEERVRGEGERESLDTTEALAAS